MTILTDILACINTLSDGSRCLGRLEPQEHSSFLCIECNSSYIVNNGVPILLDLKNTETELLKFYSNVYKKQSRTEVLHESTARMQQAQVLWHVLPNLIKKESIQGRVLEIGCGVGVFAERVSNYVGLDYALDGLLAEGFESFDRVCASGDLLPFQNETFSLIFTLNTLEHVPELEHAFQEIHRVLKHNGYLVLKPAWNCTQYNCDGVAYFPYKSLNVGNKIKKLILPLLRSKPYKILTRIPKRLFREILLRKVERLLWHRLHPRFDLMYKVADSEAYASIDTHEGIYWFLLRGYSCISHPTFVSRIAAGHDVVILKKLTCPKL
jgi:SAM-dependent methyltransferase